MDAVATPAPSALFRQRTFVLVLLVFFVALSVQYTFKVLDSDRDNRSAFLRWRAQVLELDEGFNIWQRHNYPNPPIMVLLLEPLMFLPPLVGSLTWFYLKVVMALVAIHMTFRALESPEQPWPMWAKALAVLLSLRPIMGDLSHGNVNLFILLLCVGTLYLFHQRRDAFAGLCLALAIACKVTPALLLPYFLWKRSWKLLSSSAVGLVLFFWLIPGLQFGFEQNRDYLTSWYTSMIKPFAIEGQVTTDHENQSLPGLVHRMLTDCGSFSTYIDDLHVPTESHNLVSWDPTLARAIVKGCMALFALLVLWTCRNPTDHRERWQLAAEFALILVGMLLFSERTWKHHCVTLLVPFSVLCYFASTEQSGRGMRRFVIAMLVVVVLLMTSTSTGWSRNFERFGKLAQVYGAYVWANLILATTLIVVLRQQFLSSKVATKMAQFRIANATKDASSATVGHLSATHYDAPKESPWRRNARSSHVVAADRTTSPGNAD